MDALKYIRVKEVFQVSLVSRMFVFRNESMEFSFMPILGMIGVGLLSYSSSYILGLTKQIALRNMGNCLFIICCLSAS